MKDVARMAGVSTSTVSHVINKDRFVSEAIREKVDAAIKELNYAPSALARSLKLNQTRTIGMLITASTNPFYSELVRGVERSCFERGYSLVLCNTEGDEQRMNRNLETLMQKRVDGLLLLCTETHQPSKEIIQRYPSIPTVMMDWAPFDGTSDLIQDNSLLGGDMATQHLIDKGHTRIACITGPLDKTPARLRLEGYLSAMERAGLAIPDGYRITGDFEFNGGFEAMQKLLAQEPRPQAVFIGNDAMAFGAYQALYQAGLRVPDDMAIVGYDAGIDRGWFYFWVTLCNQLYWVTGATLGGLIGAHLPFNTDGLDFVLTALFLVIFLDQWLDGKHRERLSAVIGVLTSLACLLIFGANDFMIPSMIAMLILFVALRPHLDVLRPAADAPEATANHAMSHAADQQKEGQTR